MPRGPSTPSTPNKPKDSNGSPVAEPETEFLDSSSDDSNEGDSPEAQVMVWELDGDENCQSYAGDYNTINYIVEDLGEDIGDDIDAVDDTEPLRFTQNGSRASLSREERRWEYEKRLSNDRARSCTKAATRGERVESLTWMPIR